MLQYCYNKVKNVNLADYEAYLSDPNTYNYEDRKIDRNISREWISQEIYNIPKSLTDDEIKESLTNEEEER